MLFVETAWFLWWCEISITRKQARCYFLHVKITFAPNATEPQTSHHPHLWEVDQIVFSVVRRSFFNESQISEVHPQVWYTGRITASEKKTYYQHPLSLLNALFSYFNRRCLDIAYFFRASLKFLNLPSDETSFWSLSISAFVYGKGANRKCILSTEVQEKLQQHLQKLKPVWRLLARFSWGEKQSSGLEMMWFQAQHCSYANNGRCQPQPPISLWQPLEWPSRHTAGSLLRSGCLSSDEGERKISFGVNKMSISVFIWLTSLKCLVVLMMYGVFSFLSFFIQPWPKNSLKYKDPNLQEKLERWTSLK